MNAGNRMFLLQSPTRLPCTLLRPPVCDPHLDQALVAQRSLVGGGNHGRIVAVGVGHAASRVPAAGS